MCILRAMQYITGLQSMTFPLCWPLLLLEVSWPPSPQSDGRMRVVSARKTCFWMMNIFRDYSCMHTDVLLMLAIRAT